MEEEHCLNNWDLHAVVRSACRRLSPPPPPRQRDPFASFPPAPEAAVPVAVKELQGVDAGWSFPDLGARDGSGFGRDADELLRAFCAAAPPVPPPPPPLPEKLVLQPVMPPADVPVQAAAPTPAPATARAQPSGRQVSGSGGVPRSKRRKNQQKKVVCHVPADGVSADVWAWRKYGQKPIKGSPYPRGYYRCSSSKGCAARKQVERSRSDPNTFILTYTGEHNHAAPTHRNSLAGTTRHKFPSPPPPQPPPPSIVASAEAQQQRHHQPLSPPSTSAGLSPTTPLRTPSMEEDEEEEDELLVEDMDIAGEDELLFLSGGDSDPGSGATPMSSLFDAVDEPFLDTPWASAAAGAGAASAAS